MSALKIAVPLLILAVLAVTVIPMFLIWYVNDIQTNVTVTGDNGIWTTYTHGLNMITTILAEFSYPAAIILIVCAVVVLLVGAFVVVRKVA